MKDAWEILNPPYDLDHARPAFSLMQYYGPPKVVFIGDSHVAHMRGLHLNSDFYRPTRNFLSSSQYIGVGGTKWWLASDELFGIFADDKKQRKYGKQWVKHVLSGAVVNSAVCCLGSNDADDYMNYIMKPKLPLESEAFYDYAIDAMNEWLSLLLPIVTATTIKFMNLLPYAKFHYYPIVPRS